MFPIVFEAYFENLRVYRFVAIVSFQDRSRLRKPRISLMGVGILFG